MATYRSDLADSVKSQTSFGIWDMLNAGADPFGDPVRNKWRPEDAIELLGRLDVPRISLHDIDVGLDPWLTDAAGLDKRFNELRQSLKDNGVQVWMYTPCLFKHPLVRAGSVTANDERVRRMSLHKIIIALDMAEAFGASWVTFWLGRDGAEIDALIDGKTAYQRIADAVHMACAYIRAKGYKVRLSLEPKPNEPRGDIYISTSGTALGIISMLPQEDQGMVKVNPELLQHEAMAGLNSYHAASQLIAADKLAFLHLGGQTPLRYDQDHPFLGGNSSIKESFYIMLAVARHAPDTVLEFDCHPFRTEAHDSAREEFILANLEAAGMLMDKAKSFLANSEVQQLLDDTESRGFGLSKNIDSDLDGFLQELNANLMDPSQLAADINPQAQRLDMLVNRHLLGYM